MLTDWTHILNTINKPQQQRLQIKELVKKNFKETAAKNIVILNKMDFHSKAF